MANVSSILMIALLFCSMLLCTARPDPALSASIAVVPAEPYNLEKKVERKLDDVEEENCRGEDEDCLMRRTLVAHVDYIYTQKQKKNL